MPHPAWNPQLSQHFVFFFFVPLQLIFNDALYKLEYIKYEDSGSSFSIYKPLLLYSKLSFSACSDTQCYIQAEYNIVTSIISLV